MATMTLSQMPNTFTLTIPKADVSFFKTMAKKMGWSVERKRATAKVKRLYDPDTGECTKAIGNVISTLTGFCSMKRT